MGSDTPLYDHVLALSASADPAQRFYVIADQSAIPRIAALWRHVAALPWTSLMPSGDEQPDGATPLLVEVTELNKTHRPQLILNALYEHAGFANALSVIVSALPFAHLANALTERTHAELPDRLKVRLRFFDTRTLPLLPMLLNANQYAAFMSCAISWDYVDRYGQLQTLPAPRGDAVSTETYERLIFDSEQERVLIDDGTTDAIIDQLLDQRHPAFVGATPPKQYDMISPLVEAARAFEIVEINDVLRYCCAALAHGADFHERAPWAERLARHREGRLTLEEALSDES